MLRDRRNYRTWIVGLAILAAVLGAPETARADDRQVPVPDVRGMSEQAARQVLQRAGLTVGGVERIDAARLQQELGRSYAPGVTVQQAPPPSTSALPSWLVRGGQVWLRVAAGQAGPTPPTPRPSTPIVTTPPVPVPVPGPTPGPSAPRTTTQPRYPGTMPRPPPPPAPPGMGDTTPYVQPGPRTVPMPYQPQPTQPLAVQPRPYQPGAVYPGSGAGALEVPSAQADASPALPRNIRTQVGLPCERLRDTWSIVGAFGWAFTAGSDSGTSSYYAGVDVMRTLSSCFAFGLYYRYSAQVFDRQVTGGILEDAGGFHHIGLKLGYQSTFKSGSRWYWWTALGIGWNEAMDYQRNWSGFEAHAAIGAGYLIKRQLRVRVGLESFVMESKAGRFDPGRDGSSRLLWWFAPQISLEYDF
ncbi:MAG: PASTA domain-containing protein [Planctomycetota bacterium]|nr:PASTA domain-containing protein [Planctomycetota bacterium]